MFAQQTQNGSNSPGSMAATVATGKKGQDFHGKTMGPWVDLFISPVDPLRI